MLQLPVYKEAFNTNLKTYGKGVKKEVLRVLEMKNIKIYKCSYKNLTHVGKILYIKDMKGNILLRAAPRENNYYKIETTI